ncbi:tRNA lysidine(34) synthetase TilS [Salinibacter altiplanensis]|uniref:tRNA lysidine(34) synthetase TilS n=1 Tax=Salinibacter altiplanensis TaxID=1803181 RepID=UPI000C9F273B|nr:tRNA lysidine(34) synthetase TilS [Salinibacter altiplanensis]
MSHTLVDTVAAFSERYALLDDEPILVAASGGVDSMTCLSVLRHLGVDVHALHANYGLRAGADADEALVRRWCSDQSPPVPLSVVALDAERRVASNDESLQEAARRLRYDALADHAAEIGAAAVATGHHRDDQAETLLLNLVRGSGPEGLAGMRPARPLKADSSVLLVRPLLNVRRAAIESYADAIGLPWRTDPTNRRHDYDRGVVRTDILPRLESHFEGATDALARSADLMQEYVDQALRPGLNQRMAQAYTGCEAGGALSVAVLRAEPSVWRRRLLLEALRRTLPAAPYSRAVAEELESLVEAQVGKRVEVGAGTVWRERGQLRFVPGAATHAPASPTPVEWGTPVSIPQGRLRVELCDERPASLASGTPHVAYADADRLGTAPTVRPWADGDRIRPLGLDGTKPVSDLLTEARVPPHDREHVSVLCGNDRIAWVVSHRLAHRVRVRPETDRVARLVLRPHENPSDN